MEIRFPAYHFEGICRLDEKYAFEIKCYDGPGWYIEIWFDGNVKGEHTNPCEELWLFKWEKILPNRLAIKIYKNAFRKMERKIITRLKEEKGYRGPFMTWV